MSNAIAKERGQRYSQLEHMELVVRTKSLIVKGVDSPATIARTLNVDYKTAHKLRGEADVLFTRENLNVDSLRKKQIGRMNFQIEGLSNLVADELTYIEKDKANGERPRYHKIIGLYRELRGYHETFNKITGLNTEVVLTSERKRITFIMPGVAEKEPPASAESIER